MLRIRDILIRIRIRGSIRLRIMLFSSVTFKMATRNNFFGGIFACYFLKRHLRQFSKIKSHIEVTKQWESRFFLSFLLMIEGSVVGYHTNGSGSGRKAQKHPVPEPQHWSKPNLVSLLARSEMTFSAAQISAMAVIILSTQKILKFWNKFCL